MGNQCLFLYCCVIAGDAGGVELSYFVKTIFRLSATILGFFHDMLWLANPQK